jgi:hypothetical protein
MPIRTVILAALLIMPRILGASTVDRIVASVGNQGMTKSEVDQEVRFAQFLDGQPQTSEPSEAQWVAARDRLVEQMLLAQEAEADKVDEAGLPEEATRLVDEVRQLYPDEAAYRAALAATGFTQDQAEQRLTRNVKILRLINRRLRPNAWVERREIEAYYKETFLPEFAKQEKASPPTIDDVETVIRETLTQKKVDELLDQWLKEVQMTRRVKLHSQ